VDRQPVESYLEDIRSWKIRENDQARKVFIDDMKSRQFGREETRDAWHWFIHGWVAAIECEYEDGDT
jgi:hypothetical protein